MFDLDFQWYLGLSAEHVPQFGSLIDEWFHCQC